MTEKYPPYLHEIISEKEKKGPEPTQRVYTVDSKGVLFVDGFGNLNEPYNADAHEPDEDGLSKVDRWLETEKDEKGKYVRAWMRDQQAYNQYMNNLLRRGEQIRKSASEPQERIKRIGRSEQNNISLENFTQNILEYIGSESGLKDTIADWELRQLKSKPGDPPIFRLKIAFIDDWSKSGQKNKNFKGTYEEVLKEFEKELDRRERHLQVVGEER